MEKYELGLKKKSFSIFFNGGEIWCEHLDSLYNEKELLKLKFNQDLVQLSWPPLRKVVFVGLNSNMKSYIKKKNIDTSFTMACIDDFEKAKEWLV